MTDRREFIGFFVKDDKLWFQEPDGDGSIIRELHGGAGEAGSELQRWLEEHELIQPIIRTRQREEA